MFKKWISNWNWKEQNFKQQLKVQMQQNGDEIIDFDSSTVLLLNI